MTLNTAIENRNPKTHSRVLCGLSAWPLIHDGWSQVEKTTMTWEPGQVLEKLILRSRMSSVALKRRTEFPENK